MSTMVRMSAIILSTSLAGLAFGQVVSEVTFESPSAVAGDPIMDSVGDVGPQWSSIPQGDPFVWPLYSAETPTQTFPEYVSEFSADFSGGMVAFEQNELDVTESWTVEAFVRFNDVGGYQTVIGREGTVGGPQHGELYLQKVPGEEEQTGRFKVEYLNSLEEGSTSWLYGATPLVTQTWYHVAAVYNAETDRLALYVNGQIDGISRSTRPALISDHYWTIGRGWYNGSAGDWVNGQIDGVRFSNGALSPQEFQIDVPGTSEPGCPADFDGNGTRNVQDLLAFLSAFRAGCN